MKLSGNLSEQSGQDVDAYASRTVDSLFDSLTLTESAILAPMMLHWVNLAADAVILTVGGDNYYAQRRLFDMEQEFAALHTELLGSREPKIAALITAANLAEAQSL